MRLKPKQHRPLAILLAVMILCMSLTLPWAGRSAQAAEANLADKAVAFIQNQYDSEGAQNDPTIHYPYAAYVLQAAGVDLSGWEHEGVAMTEAVCALVDDDIANASAAVKYLAQDLLIMQAWHDEGRLSQLQTILHDRQLADGSFQDDSNPYSIIAAYELLGRGNQLSGLDTAAAQTYILGQQETESGAWPETWLDFMTTAEAVRALAYLEPDYTNESAAGIAINQGIDWLQQQQESDGSFKTTWDDPLIDSVEAIAAQKALGLSPDSAWTNSGYSAVDYLQNSAVNADGSFGSGQNLMDAVWALDGCILLDILPAGSGGGGEGEEEPPASVTVQVRVEGAAACLADTTVTVSGTALDALYEAVGEDNVEAPGGFISSIYGESGIIGAAEDTDTCWFYYVIRNNAIDPQSLSSSAGGYNVAEGDQIVFYIGAYGHTTYAPKTYLPVVSITPQSPGAGQTVTLNISALKYDWSAGLQELSSDEIAAIGNYTVRAGDDSYTSLDGQASIPNVRKGTLSYAVINQNSAGYPNVVPYRGSITVSGNIGASLMCLPGVAVVGMSGELLFGPSTVVVCETDEWGLTALGALDATGLSYTISADWDGFVESIEGQANSGQQGWMYTVNDSTPEVLAKDYSIERNDHVIWYYSLSMDQDAPTWAEIITGDIETEIPVPAASSTGSAMVHPLGGGTIGLGSEASIEIPVGALQGNTELLVSITKLDSPPAAPEGYKLLGSVLAFTVENSSSYQFLKPVTLTFYFDPDCLSPGETPIIYYYDESNSNWVQLGGLVSGNSITVKVDHFTNFAVMTLKDTLTETPATQSGFTDIDSSHWASEAINMLHQRAYISGYPDGTFQPDKSISRAEAISILNQVLKVPAAESADLVFNDVFSRDWYYDAVQRAVQAGLAKGYGSSFKPDAPISRQELAVMLINALGKTEEAGARQNEKSSFTDDASIPDWSRGAIQVAVQNGLIKGYPDNGFHPRSNATRAEVCMMVKNFLAVYEAAQ